MEKINQEIISCEKCVLSQTRNNAVPGIGNRSAEIMLIGEAPGKNEDEQGKPFIGRAGKVLDEMLVEIGLERADIFITNVVKCRPPKNRDPLPIEKKSCLKYLAKQIKIVQPKIIVLLGRHAMSNFLPKAAQIGKVHGQVFEGEDGLTYFPVYHPAAALYNPKQKEVLKEDFLKLQQLLERLKNNLN